MCISMCISVPFITYYMVLVFLVVEGRSVAYYFLNPPHLNLCGYISCCLFDNHITSPYLYISTNMSSRVWKSKIKMVYANYLYNASTVWSICLRTKHVHGCKFWVIHFPFLPKNLKEYMKHTTWMIFLLS